MADAPNSEFDRWDEDSPDVKGNDEAAFSAALAAGAAQAAQLQREAASFQGGDAEGNLGAYGSTD